MIITKVIKKKITGGNIKNYRKYGNIGDTFYLPVEDLSKNSHQTIHAKCENCGEIKEIKYQTYNRNTKDGVLPYHCNKKECINKKREMSIELKYGCKNVFQIEDVKGKIKETNLEKYGVENPHQSKDIKKKCENTNLEKYGCKNVFQNEDIKEKIKETNLKNLGVEYPTQSNIVMEKIKETNLKNFGVEWTMQNKDCFIKAGKSSLKIKKYEDTDLYYQGTYEKEFLDKYYNKVKIENGLSIPYKHNGEDLYYLSDFYLPEYDLVVEIKSTYWYKVHDSKCISKENGTKKKHKYIMILDKDYKLFDKIIN